MNILSKLNTFYKVSLGVFALLWIVRTLFPSVLHHNDVEPEPPMPPISVIPEEVQESTRPSAEEISRTFGPANSLHQVSGVAKVADAQPLIRTMPRHGAWHPIKGVVSYDASFNDVQDVQIVAAQQWGVTPPRNRDEAESRKSELVYVGISPYYHLDPVMKSSIPYLVPRAALLLDRIGHNFYDSCYVKGIPLHKIIVSSLLRSEEDVERLAVENGNVSKQSCHRYGTTMDVCYTRFHPVSNPDGPSRRTVRDDTLKWVLSEVLRDLRQEGACYVKHEVKQSCFHITVR